MNHRIFTCGVCFNYLPEITGRKRVILDIFHACSNSGTWRFLLNTCAMWKGVPKGPGVLGSGCLESPGLRGRKYTCI